MTASDSTVHNVKRCVYVCVAFLSVCLCFLRHCLCVRCVVFFFLKCRLMRSMLRRWCTAWVVITHGEDIVTFRPLTKMFR